MTQVLELKTEESWRQAQNKWNDPSIPHLIAPASEEELKGLKETGNSLREELAFMRISDFQIYANIPKIRETFNEDQQRGLNAVLKHETGHRFCPYDLVTSIILRHDAEQKLKEKKCKFDLKASSNLMLNLFTDMCINTTLTRRGEQDIPWAYRQLSKDNNSGLWKVYAASMELAWNTKLLPEDTKLNEEEKEASRRIAGLFREDFFNKNRWRQNMREYAGIMSNFLEQPEQAKGSKGKGAGTGMDSISDNIPSSLDEKTSSEIAKRLSEIGTNGLPTNPAGLKEFKDILAGFGKGDPLEASILFYDRLSDAYNVTFAEKPFGRPRENPLQPVKWQPSMGVDRLDVDYSVQVGGRVIPGVNAYTWNTRRRESHGGFEETTPHLDLYLDSSQSMPNPIETISLPVLAGFVASKKALRKGASVRVTNFSGKGQCETQEWTATKDTLFRKLVRHLNGGTVFPTNALTESSKDPKQILVITDTFIGNEEETIRAIQAVLDRNKGNRVAVYAISPSPATDYLRTAGAEVIRGTTTDIFRSVIGKADEVYRK